MSHWELPPKGSLEFGGMTPILGQGTEIPKELKLFDLNLFGKGGGPRKIEP